MSTAPLRSDAPSRHELALDATVEVPVSIPGRVSCIVHGVHAAPRAHAQFWPTRVRAAGAEIELIEAFEDPRRVVGAAALIQRAAATATGDVLLVAEAGVTGDADADPAPLADLLAHAMRGLALGHAADAPPAAAEAVDAEADAPFLDWVIERTHARPEATADGSQDDPPIWAMRKSAFEAAGGLDARLWHVGAVADLAARARLRGIDVIARPLPFVRREPAYRVHEPLRRLLAVRGELITAFKTAPLDELAPRLAVACARAWLAMWRATGLQAEDFAFGGRWGAPGSLAGRLLGRTPPDLRWAQSGDPLIVLAPLLALDAFLDELPSLMAERSPAIARPPAAPPDDPLDTPNTFDAALIDRGSSDALVTDAAAVVRGSALPSISVIVVNWNGEEHLRPCFESLSRSDYPADRVELICVDNGSTDGSRALLAREFPHVRVVALDRNTGFTAGNEEGVASARGDVLLFLNNDMRVEPDCLREIVAPLDETCACVGARVLSWDGRRIDFLRGTLNFEARGYQEFFGVRNGPDLPWPAETFFPNGGAFAVTRAAYDRAGGFDRSFFAYYDDVDLGWRLRLTGTPIRVAAKAIVYHRHGATSGKHPSGQKRFLMDRNALWSVLKNYGDGALRRTLGPILLLAARRVLDNSRIPRRGRFARTFAPLAGRCRPPGVHEWSADRVYVDRDSVDRAGRASDRTDHADADAGLPHLRIAELAAIGCGLDALPTVAAERRRVQARRRVPDRDVLPLFGRTFESLSSFSSYKKIEAQLMEALDVPALFRTRTRLLIISHEAVARNMSGPAVRVLELGRALSSVARVTVATPAAVTIEDTRCTFASFDPANSEGLRRLAEDADVLLVQGFALAQYPFLKHLLIPIIVDLYCPFTLEHLEMTRPRLLSGAADLAHVAHEATAILGVQNEQLHEGDFFICASETQRDFWMGALHGAGRLNPLTYGEDASVRRLIDVVPFGLPEEPVTAAVGRAAAARGGSRAVMKGVWPQIGPRDRVLLWAGSLLDWQDPLTLIRAIAALAETRSDVKLVFMGTKHPNPLVSPMRIVEDSRALAQSLGVLDRHVIFNDWVPYDERALYLAEADLGVSTHLEHLETHFSFRTRMLDYIWAGVPIVCTHGDVFADLVRTRGLGRVVPAGDVDALRLAIAALLDDEDERTRARRALAVLADELRWSRVARPLARFCERPTFAADRAPAMRAFRARLEDQYRLSKWMRRTALRLGVPEQRFEQFKQSAPARLVLQVRNRLALRRARRPG